MPARPTAGAAALVLVLALASCSQPQHDIGSTKPPESFGKVATAFTGCPKIAGKYKWPATEGVVEGYTREGTVRRDKHATPEFFGISFRGPGEFEIKAPPADKELVFVSYQQQRIGRPSPYGAQQGFNIFKPSAHECTGGWFVIKEYDHPHSAARENYGGGGAKIGAKLAPLADGDLVIGRWVRATGQRSSFLPFNAGPSVPAPDKVYWQWARFERVKD